MRGKRAKAAPKGDGAALDPSVVGSSGSGPASGDDDDGDRDATHQLPAIALDDPLPAGGERAEAAVDEQQPQAATLHVSEERLRTAGIELLNGPEDGNVYPLLAETVLVGREPREATGEIAIPTDPMVSRRHLRLSWREGGWWVEDLGSANGTQRMSDGASIGTEPVLLAPEQALRIGGTLLQLVLLPDGPQVSLD